MAQFKFDGSNLYSNGSQIGRVSGNSIYDAHSSQVGRVDGNNIYDRHSSQIGRIDGNTIYDGHGSRVGSMDDVRRAIEGPGGTTLAALWLCFVR